MIIEPNKFQDIYSINRSKAKKVLGVLKDFKTARMHVFSPEKSGSYEAVFSEIGDDLDEFGKSMRTSYHVWMTPDRKLVVHKGLERKLIKELREAAA